MRLALDAMGGDLGPGPAVAGARLALDAAPDLSLVLVGDRALIEPNLGDTPRAASNSSTALNPST